MTITLIDSQRLYVLEKAACQANSEHQLALQLRPIEKDPAVAFVL